MARQSSDSKDTKKQNTRLKPIKKSSSIVGSISKEPTSECKKFFLPAEPLKTKLKASKKEKTSSEKSSSSPPLTSAEARRLVKEDPDFVYVKRFDYSLKRITERYPEGVPARLIAQALFLAEDDIEKLYNDIIAKLKREMGIDE